nr:ATP-binding cassette domain-containing protein [Marivibrio halodurans]
MLTIVDVGKRFGGVSALDKCSVEFESGKITAVIGPNGAGKSTLLNCISGALVPDSGSIRLFDDDVTGAKPHILARKGLARTFQISRELSSLTLLENLLLADRPSDPMSFFAPVFRRARVLDEQAEAVNRAMGLLRRVGLDRLADETASALSGGQKKLLELSRALMLKPRVVLLDEPAAGVAPPMVKVLIEVIRDLHAEGVDFVLVEHNMDMVAALSDEVVVMAEGTPLMRGDFKAVTTDARVAEAYLGGVV